MLGDFQVWQLPVALAEMLIIGFVLCCGIYLLARYMRTPDPAVPYFEVYVGERKVALLCEPQKVEMFWCSYRVQPTSEEADRILHDEVTWNEVKFTVRAKDGRTLLTFPGGDFTTFCRRETDRLSFRSLWPIDS